jgi:hypothetical protein
VRDGVVGHVDGGVGEGLDEVLLVPRQAAAQPKRARARPLVQPAQGVLERMAGLVTEEVHAGKTPLHLGPPLRLAIGEVPGRGKRAVRKGRGCSVVTGRDSANLIRDGSNDRQEAIRLKMVIFRQKRKRQGKSMMQRSRMCTIGQRLAQKAG